MMCDHSLFYHDDSTINTVYITCEFLYNFSAWQIIILNAVMCYQRGINCRGHAVIIVVKVRGRGG